MGGLLLLLALSVVMALASFLAGALPLSMSLSQSQLRLLSSIGIGILVGTSLVVIIPEGVEAVASTSSSAHSHNTRSLGHTRGVGLRQDSWTLAGLPPRDVVPGVAERHVASLEGIDAILDASPARRDEEPPKGEDATTPPSEDDHGHDGHDGDGGHDGHALPTFYIGFSLMIGFVFMFLVDRLPRHASDKFQAAPATRHISLDNLASSSVSGEEEAEGFLESLAPPAKQSRSLATTTGLVIHAAADGIAMGASATTADMKLGFVIFAAIMIHKAPAAFGLTSVLLRQGLSKRAARGHLVVFSLAAPLGALGTYVLISILGGRHMEGEAGLWWTGMLLLFSAGTFLYVAMHAMQEDGAGHDHHGGMNGYSEGGGGGQRRQNKPQMRDTLATVAGMLLPLLTQFGHHH